MKPWTEPRGVRCSGGVVRKATAGVGRSPGTGRARWARRHVRDGCSPAEDSERTADLESAEGALATPYERRAVLAGLFFSAAGAAALDRLAPSAGLGAHRAGSDADGTAQLSALASATTGWNLAARAATRAGGAYTLASSFENGDILDGVTLATGDRILLKDLAKPTQNGVYTVCASGAPTRATDFDAGAQFPQATVWVSSGLTNAGTAWRCTNASPPTLGVTAIFWAKAIVGPPELQIAASDSTWGRCRADLVCDGIADELEVNTAFYVLKLTGVPRGKVRLSPGTFNIASPIVPQSDTSLEGAGSYRTTALNRVADTVIIDLSGTADSDRRRRVRLSDLSLQGKVAPHVSPAIRAWYSSDHVFERLDLRDLASIGIQGVCWYDSILSGCRFVEVASAGLGPRVYAEAGTGTGGRPAIQLLGCVAPSGDGYTTATVNSLRFCNCTFENNVDGAIEVHGNTKNQDFAGQAMSRPNKIRFSGCKFENQAGYNGYAPFVRAQRANIMWFEACEFTSQAGYDGWTTAQPQTDFDTCENIMWGNSFHSHCGTSSTIRSGIRFKECTGVACPPYLGVSWSGNAPTVAIIEFVGANKLVRRDSVSVVWHPDGSLIAVSGVPASEFEAHGTALIPSGSTSIRGVAHRMARTPTEDEIQVWATGAATNDPGLLWVTGITATTFDVACRSDPGAGGLAVAWRARVGDGAV